MRFVVFGAAGFVARRHLKAIYDTGNEIIAVVDPYDAIGILDGFSLDIEYFKSVDEFTNFCRSLSITIDYISICTPNYLHFEHCKAAMDLGANVICEKPLVIHPKELDELSKHEILTKTSIFTVLQLRLHPKLVLLREEIQKETAGHEYDVTLTYIPTRGKWYNKTWKANEDTSGGVATNIGIHFFDLLLWLFGNMITYKVYMREPDCISGYLQLENAKVRWFLSINPEHLPTELKSTKQTTYRSITVDGKEIEFTHGFNDLHTRVYENTLSGKGFTISDAKPSLELVHNIRFTELSPLDSDHHPFMSNL